MIDIDDIKISPLEPRKLPDFLTFFDKRAFADNPEWSFCYCQFPQFQHDDLVWKEQEASDNRETACNLIRQGKMNGFLAYHGDSVVGWCNAGPRISMTTVPEYIEPDEQKIGSIMCFVVEKAYRRQGISRKLLRAACKSFEEQGFTIIEAYPLIDAKSEKENHFGPLQMFLSAGFKEYREDDGVMVTRLYLQRVERKQ